MTGEPFDEDSDRGDPDPKPEETPGLEPGGQVRPGDTPPAEAAATSGLAHQEKGPNRWAHVVTVALMVVVAIVVAGLFVGLLIGLL